MRKILIFFLGICIIACSQISFGQEIKVSDPKLELRDNTIHITYDILNSTPSEEFTVELRITDSNGNQIHAAALKGDVGDMVPGGNNKHIAWDLELDKIEMNASIHVNIYVKAVFPPEPVVKEPEEEQAVEKDSEVEKPEKSFKQFNRTALILQSVALPGLGLTRYKGGPHWIKGVAGYGCLVGAVVMNRKAIDTYSGINDLTDVEEKNAMYQESVKQDNISETLVYTAIGIWVIDLVWTIVGTSDLKQSSLNQKGIRIFPVMDPVSNAPLIAFTYKF